MASSERLIQKYLWLIKTILQAKRITLKDINQLWLKDTSTRLETEGELSEGSFFRYKKDIRKLFGIEIGFHRNKGNTYFIENAERLANPSIYTWFLTSLVTLTHLVGREELNERIIFEKSSGGFNYIPTIIEAIKENRIVIIRHLLPNCYFPKEIRLEPYCLKQYLQDWYVIGIKPDTLSTFSVSLGNILTITITNNTFIPDKWEEIRSSCNEIILNTLTSAVKTPDVSSIRYSPDT